MQKNIDVKQLASRLVNARKTLLKDYPFFGKLLLRLSIGFAKCETAFTDMKNVVFDPEFVARLTDKQLSFVYLHELFHCVLFHCTRAKNYHRLLFNIACDIVVNSMILEMFGVSSFEIDGSDAMHLTPDGKEGRLYSAEQVYNMLLDKSEEEIEKCYGKGILDNHNVWQEITDSALEDMWDNYVRKASKDYGDGSGIPTGLRRYLREIKHQSKTNWRALLQEYLRHDNCDYLMSVPDRRYQGDFFMPSFVEDTDSANIENIWFFVDTSGSVTDDAVSKAYFEIKDAVDQIDSLKGYLCFFDTIVSEPCSFDSVDSLSKIQAVGGGGTSFHAVFEYIKTNLKEKLPSVVVIITDGYAPFPEPEQIVDVPVIWLVVNSEVDPPFGKVIHIETKEEY